MNLVEKLQKCIHHETVAEKCILIDLKEKNPYYSHMILAIANNSRAIIAVSDKLRLFAKQNHISINVEGKNTDWLVIEFDHILVHIFTEELRQEYELEKLWELAGVTI